MPLPIFLVFAIEFTLNNKPKTTVPKSFFMNLNPSTIILGTIVAQFSNNFWLSVFQLCCKIRIVEAVPLTLSNRTSQFKSILL